MNDSKGKSGRRADQPAPEPSGTLDGSLANELGADHRFAPEAQAPPVDRDKLLRYVRRELSPPVRREVSGLIATYRSWYQAWRAALIDDAKPEQT